jgi:hypothetical protein
MTSGQELIIKKLTVFPKKYPISELKTLTGNMLQPPKNKTLNTALITNI